MVENEVSRVRVIAGTYRDATGPAKSFTPVTLLHVTLNANGTAKIDLPEGHNALVYAVSGDAEVGQTRVRGRHMALLPRSGGDVELYGTEGAELLVLAGAPIGEPFGCRLRQLLEQGRRIAAVRVAVHTVAHRLARFEDVVARQRAFDGAGLRHRGRSRIGSRSVPRGGLP